MKFHHLFTKKKSDLIALILSELINETVHRGIYPDFFKVARVKPISKSGSQFDFENYTPISAMKKVS